MIHIEEFLVDRDGMTEHRCLVRPLRPLAPQLVARLLSDAFYAERLECADRWAAFGVW